MEFLRHCTEAAHLSPLLTAAYKVIILHLQAIYTVPGFSWVVFYCVVGPAAPLLFAFLMMKKTFYS